VLGERGLIIITSATRSSPRRGNIAVLLGAPGTKAFMALRVAEEIAPDEVTGRPSVHRLVRDVNATSDPAFQTSPAAIICRTEATGTHSSRATSLTSVGSPIRSGSRPTNAKSSPSTAPARG
jgi:hypothetical protein